MFNRGEERRQMAVTAAQQALGALQHLSPTQMVTEVGGRRVEIVLHGAESGGVHARHEPNHILELRFPLAVPIRFGLETRSNYVHVGQVPIITTGDPLFDAVYAVLGVPSEVVQRALDGPTRVWVQQYGQPHLALHTDASGALSFMHSVSLPRENPRRLLTPQVLTDAANALWHFANTLEATYGARRAEIVAEQGEAGALAWEEQNKALIAARPMRWLRWVLAGCLGLVVLGFLAATAAFVVGMMRITG